MSELVFRGLRGRTFEDQKQAIVDGYGSVAEMAIDELGALVLELRQRVDALEAAQGKWGRDHPVTKEELDRQNNPTRTWPYKLNDYGESSDAG